ncbi:MAG: hypothetical protein COA43_00655 [Robiginitomaculum sp.]|nr:MAG: hypothetical protein COA43_00655 [Robiginitomaculum sp.]
MSELNKSSKTRQRLMILLLLGSLLTITGLFVFKPFEGDKKNSNSKRSQKYAPRAIVDAGTQALSDEDFMADVQSRLTEKDRIDVKTSADIKRLLEIAEDNKREIIATSNLVTEFDDLRLTIEDMKKVLDSKLPSNGVSVNRGATGFNGSGFNPSQTGDDPFARRVGGQADRNSALRPPTDKTRKIRITGQNSVQPDKILRITKLGDVHLERLREKKDDGDGLANPETGPKLSQTKAPQIYNTKHYVPANAYANATVIMGADASTGVTSASDPLPVLLRITSPAYHVFQDGEIKETNLSGCLVNGSARGDLSSEKVLINLHVITCPNGDGTVSENKVSGFVAHLGKGGVRGTVVNRSGELLKLAALSGFIGGIAQVAERNATQGLTGLGGLGGGGIIAQQKLSAGELAQAGGLGGLSGAANQLTEYAVDRMEQLQPIIEMPTGAEVDIFFLEGVQVRAEDKQ